MPYERTVRLATPCVQWQELRLLEAQPLWSEAYRPDCARLLMPRSDWMECEIRGRAVFCDRLAAVWLSPVESYRMRQPWREQRHVLLVLPGVEEEWAGTGASSLVPLPPRAAWWLASGSARLRSALPCDALGFEEAALAFVGQVLSGKAASRRTDDERRHPAVDRAREWLNAEPGANHTLAEIAAAAGASPFHLARRFRRATGSSLHAYRTALRMALAAERIAEGEADLTALALDLGYSSHSHFSAAFKRCFGAAPRSLRQAQRTISIAHPLH